MDLDIRRLPGQTEALTNDVDAAACHDLGLAALCERLLQPARLDYNVVLVGVNHVHRDLAVIHGQLEAERRRVLAIRDPAIVRLVDRD